MKTTLKRLSWLCAGAVVLMSVLGCGGGNAAKTEPSAEDLEKSKGAAQGMDSRRK